MDLLGITLVLPFSADPVVGHGVHLDVGNAINLDDAIQMMVAAEASKDAAPASHLIRILKDGAHGRAVVDAAFVLQTLVAQDDDGLIRLNQLLFQPRALLVAHVSGIARGSPLVTIITVEHDEAITGLHERVVTTFHSHKRTCLFPRFAPVHVVVTEDIVRGPLESSPHLEKVPVPLDGLAEIAHLDEEVGFPAGHGLHETGQAFGRIVHDVLMDVRAHTKAQRLEALPHEQRVVEGEYRGSYEGLPKECASIGRHANDSITLGT